MVSQCCIIISNQGASRHQHTGRLFLLSSIRPHTGHYFLGIRVLLVPGNPIVSSCRQITCYNCSDLGVSGTKTSISRACQYHFHCSCKHMRDLSAHTIQRWQNTHSQIMLTQAFQQIFHKPSSMLRTPLDSKVCSLNPVYCTSFVFRTFYVCAALVKMFALYTGAFVQCQIPR